MRDDVDNKKILGVWRLHSPPPTDRLEALEKFLENLADAYKEDPTSGIWKWDRTHGESLAAYLKRLPLSSNSRIAKAVRRAAMVSNVASELSIKPGLHFGLAADPYARFSSPMREAVGLFVHKAVGELNHWQSAVSNQELDESYRIQVVEGGNAAKKIQTEINKAANRMAIDRFVALCVPSYVCSVFSSDLLWPVSLRPFRCGTIIGVSVDKSRLYVEVCNYYGGS